VDEHLGRPTSRAALAKLAGLSPSRFHELFLAVLRCSPMAYVAERRMQRARQLLVTTARPVREIADIVGYGDPYHFSRAFKRSSGESPQAYRAAGLAGG
jgi:transcriptional regulator GlxA family with amidase domain